MGKVIPIIDSNPYLDEDDYKFFEDLLKKNPPSSMRYALILREEYVNDSVIDHSITRVHTKSRILLFNMLGSILDRFGIKDPLSSKLNILVQKPAQRGDIAQSLIFLRYILSWLISHPCRPDDLVNGMLEVESWNEQPYIAPGVNLNYAEKTLSIMKQEQGIKYDYLLEFLKDLSEDEDSLYKYINFVDTSPAISGGNLAVLKDSYFYEPPEIYGDPVRYAQYMYKSDNIGENLKIAKSLQSELNNGNFGDAHEFLEKQHYQEVIDEINREIKTLDKANSFLKVSLQFGANIMGATTGTLVGQALRQGDITLLFSFIGANAASALMKEYSGSISQRVLAPLFKRSNTSLLLWQHLKSKK